MERQRGRGLGRAEHNKGKGGAWRVGGAKGKAANKRGRGGRRGGAERGEVANRMAGVRGGGRGLGRRRGGRGGGAWNVGGAWGEQSITKERAGLGVWAGLRAKPGRVQCGGGT